MSAHWAIRDVADARLQRLLVTPEGVALRLSVASAGSRLAAFSIDAAIVVGSLIAMSLVLLLLFWALGSFGGGTGEFLAVLWLVGFFFLRNAYFLFFELGERAATPGKRVARIRVAARDGGRLTADAVIARNLLREIEVFLPLSFLAADAAQDGAGGWTAIAGLGWAGLFVMFPLLNRDRLRAGDLVAGTWVIRDPRRRLGHVLAGAPASQADEPRHRFSGTDVEAYGVYELHTLEEVLRRGDANALVSVAGAIGEKLGRPEPDDSRAFLDAYYAALKAHLERRLLLGKRRQDKHDPTR